MRVSSLAKKYTRALFDSLIESEREGVLALLKSFEQVFSKFEEIRFVLLSPVLKSEDKMTAVDLILDRISQESKRKAPDAVRNFFKILIKLSRFGLFVEIVASFEADVLASTGVTFLRVETARSLSEEEERNLTEMLSKSFGKKLKVQLSENRAIIGGLRIWRGDELIDASVVNQLHQVRESLIVQ